ncbi:MAG TPA: Asp-tRNA(Asn)/Glu-tRNA(Gln) amidotransferase subunit GatB [Spirochaetota bacterium]|nr:Asp-tRNA(Asn)/Glu-tRNA(Gln) amidotransferase subunit GatB [Spirochaetota bacterium]
MEFDTVIGLEVHAQLNTQSKIFCSCSTQFGAQPNTQVCPVCLGLPGVLPVLNKEVLKKAIMAGLALNCTVAHYSKFDRKNYFYPDLPKAYQISQYDKPICYDGYIEISIKDETKKIGITRLHMEEDAGKTIHSDDANNKVSYVDFNRTGVPLIEIVSEPDITTPDEAYQYLQTLRSILKYIEVSDCNMEEGSLRCDVNVSLKPKGAKEFGQKVEIKNLNSFRSVKLALEYEIGRQQKMLMQDETIVQETRLWDAERNITQAMRSKEEAHDYRYFPEPDLPPIEISNDYVEQLKNELPELPYEKCDRFVKQYGLPRYDAQVLTVTRQLALYYETVVSNGAHPKKASNWIMSELLAKIDDPEKIDTFIVSPQNLAILLKRIDDATISGKIAKTVFEEMLKTGNDPDAIINEKGLRQVTDTAAIESIIDEVIKSNPKSVEDFRSGKDKALKFLIGQVMKESRGKANPQIVNDIMIQKLSK